MTLRLSYRHSQTTAKPHYVGARDVAEVARSLRRQIGYGNGRNKIDHQEIVERVRRLDVNGVRVEVEWGLDAPVTDDSGAPAWIIANRQGRLDFGPDSRRGTRVFRIVTPGEEHLRNSRTADGPMDWQEFRANEFMGSFLAPEDLLRRALFRLCKRLWVPLVEEEQAQQGLPGLGGGSMKADFTGSNAQKLEPAIYELAEEFGLSPSFIQVRLRKYGLVRGLPA